MNVFLMHPRRDFDPQALLPRQAAELTKDLELETLFAAMAGEDAFLLDISRKAALGATQGDVETIRHRQQVLQDCLANAAVVRQIYDLAGEAIVRQRREYFGILGSQYPSSTLSGAIRVLDIFVDVLRRLRGVADEHAGKFRSPGFMRFLAMLRKELSDGYLAEVEHHLAALRFRHGLLMSAELGEGNAARGFLLRKPPGEPAGWLARLLHRAPPEHSFRLHERDEAGARILGGMQDRGVNPVANALAQSRDHVLAFFVALQTELAFYIGCLNLYHRLAALQTPVCFPDPEPVGERVFRASELYDVCLALTAGKRPVGNSLNADGKDLVVVTGANTGGKSTFLRSTGLAQLMMQAGMFVGASSMRAGCCFGLYTHYKREEDAEMKHGKLDEELARMSELADELQPNALVLFNESFAATNEREGAEIARQVVRALLEKRIRVFFVTHQYAFARAMREGGHPATFLRAERKPDGARTFRVVPGEPLATSFGEDLYRKIFGEEEEAPPSQEAAKQAVR